MQLEVPVLRVDEACVVQRIVVTVVGGCEIDVIRTGNATFNGTVVESACPVNIIDGIILLVTPNDIVGGIEGAGVAVKAATF